jgi:chemotaxis protein MotB
MRVMRNGMWAAAVLGIAGIGAGCQNKLHDENVKLREQNREQQARIDELRNGREQPAPEVIKPEPAPETPKPVTPPPAPEKPVAVTPPAPPPPADNGLGGLDTTVDVRAGTTTVNFVGDALFDSGQAILKQTAKKSLDQVAAALKKQYAGKPVKIQGHTDSDPIRKSKWKDNQELSQARASAVRDYLVSKGVDATVVTAEGFGSTKPKDPADKAKNRRVEIVVITQ